MTNYVLIIILLFTDLNLEKVGHVDDFYRPCRQIALLELLYWNENYTVARNSARKGCVHEWKVSTKEMLTS